MNVDTPIRPRRSAKKMRYLVTIEAFGHHSTDWYEATSEASALRKALAAKGVRIKVGGEAASVTPKVRRP